MSSSLLTNTQQDYGNKSLRVSGGSVGVLQGAGILFSVAPYITASGATGSIVQVYDSASGAALTATAPILFYQSGTATMPFYGPQPFLSGLNVLTSGAGTGVTVTYRAGL